jgi:hypothetical protein
MQEERRAAEFRSRVEAAQPVADGKCRSAKASWLLVPEGPRTVPRGTKRGDCSPGPSSTRAPAARARTEAPLEAWVDGLALEREHAEDAFVDAAERFASDEALECLDA